MKFKKLLKYRMLGYKNQALILFLISTMFSAIIISAAVVYSACFYAEQNVGKYCGGSIQIKSCEDNEDAKLMAEGQRISDDWVKEFGLDKAIESYEAMSMAGVHGENVTHMLLNDAVMDQESEKGNLLLVYEKNMLEHYIFRDLGSSIIEGRGLKEDEEGSKAVISKTFADTNALSVGGVIELQTLSGDELRLEVVGISSCEYHGNMVFPVRAAEYNYIFTTKEIVDQANQSPNIFKVDFRLADCKEADVVLHKLQDEVSGKGYVITPKLSEYQNILAGLANNQTTVSILLMTAVVMGAFIIGLFSVYSLTKRLKEIGILIAIGFKKRIIIAQYVLELYIPVLCGNICCLCVFLIAKEPVTEFMANRLTFIPDISISLNVPQVIGYFGYGLFMVLFSAAFIWYTVAAYKPKKLLMESN